MNTSLVITLMCDDRPGIIQQLSNIVAHENGVWGHSHFANLGGKFTGIVEVSVPAANRSKLANELNALNHDGMNITIESTDTKSSTETHIAFTLTANDRSGIIREISKSLADHNFSIESIQSKTESGSMAGIPLFKAELTVTSSEGKRLDELRLSLENVSDDIFVDFS
ncbi:MAG: glycine cleavage system protein R [Gammaproteobacteria bacterium]|nr:glycine cleavage system protein R [Gammaproteobacteria bacterium]